MAILMLYASISTILICWKEKTFDIWVMCLFFILSGTGSYYNITYRMGNIMLGDLGMFLCILVGLLFSFRSRQISRRSCYIVFIFLYALLIGLLHNNIFSDIFRDVKCFLYFFVSYIYCMSIKDNYQKVKCLLYSMLVVATFTTITNLNSFNEVGMANLKSGKIDREFGLGLGAYYLADVSVLLFMAKNEINKKVSELIYYFIQFFLIITCVVSYTRSVWIELIIVYIFAIVINLLYGNTNIEKKFVVTFSIILVVLALGSQAVKSDNIVIQLIVNRFNGISDQIQDENSTLAYRINDVKNNKALYESFNVIIGYGFGQLFEGLNGKKSTTPENSFLYYIVKYGVIGFILLVYKIFEKLVILLKSKKAFNIEMVVVLITHMAIAAMSGNMNKYYSLPFVAAALSIDFTLLFDNKGDEIV